MERLNRFDRYIWMRFDYMESIETSDEMMKKQKDRLFLMVFKGLSSDITYKVITTKTRHRLNEPISLDTLIELYEVIPEFIKEKQNKLC